MTAESTLLLCLAHKRTSVPDLGIYPDIIPHQKPDSSVRFSLHPLVSSGPLHLVFGEVVRLQKVHATVALGNSSRDHPMAGLSPQDPRSLGAQQTMNTWSRPVTLVSQARLRGPLGICYDWLRTSSTHPCHRRKLVLCCSAHSSTSSRQASKSAATYRRSFTANRCSAATQPPVNDVSPPTHFQVVDHRPSAFILSTPRLQILNSA